LGEAVMMIDVKDMDKKACQVEIFILFKARAEKVVVSDALLQARDPEKHG
jgi:uncharacterized membrane protein